MWEGLLAQCLRNCCLFRDWTQMRGNKNSKKQNKIWGKKAKQPLGVDFQESKSHVSDWDETICNRHCVSFLQRKHRRENNSRKSSIELWKDWRSQPVQYCLETWQGAYTLHWNTEKVGSDGGWTDLRQSRGEERKTKKHDKWTKGF